MPQNIVKLIKERDQARRNSSNACEGDKERLHAMYRIARNKVTARIRRDEKMATINFIKLYSRVGKLRQTQISHKKTNYQCQVGMKI